MAVTVDLTKTKVLRDRLKPRSPQMMKFKRAAAQDYRSFLFRRFDRFSRGGGNWPTTKRRRLGLTKFILRKTHTLYRALSPVWRNLPGQWQRFVGNKVEIGIKGGRHPKAKITVGKLAEIHNFGLGKQKRRQIMVGPDSKLINKWKKDLIKING